MRRTTKITIKMKNRILAIPAAAAEIPVNPNSPAIMDITKKNSAHFSMCPSKIEQGSATTGPSSASLWANTQLPGKIASGGPINCKRRISAFFSMSARFGSLESLSTRSGRQTGKSRYLRTLKTPGDHCARLQYHVDLGAQAAYWSTAWRPPLSHGLIEQQ
jgi:hypothetical protein